MTHQPSDRHKQFTDNGSIGYFILYTEHDNIQQKSFDFDCRSAIFVSHWGGTVFYNSVAVRKLELFNGYRSWIRTAPSCILQLLSSQEVFRVLRAETVLPYWRLSAAASASASGLPPLSTVPRSPCKTSQHKCSVQHEHPPFSSQTQQMSVTLETVWSCPHSGAPPPHHHTGLILSHRGAFKVKERKAKAGGVTVHFFFFKPKL